MFAFAEFGLPLLPGSSIQFVEVLWQLASTIWHGDGEGQGQP